MYYIIRETNFIAHVLCISSSHILDFLKPLVVLTTEHTRGMDAQSGTDGHVGEVGLGIMHRVAWTPRACLVTFTDSVYHAWVACSSCVSGSRVAAKLSMGMGTK